MSRSFENKVVLITGASSGIGRACAIAFGREGAKVVAGDIDITGGEMTASLVSDVGGEVTFVRVDVSNPESINELVAKTVETYGGLDCAVNNAGTPGGAIAPIDEYPVDTWNQVVAVNLSGTFHAMRAQIPAMLQRGGGSIVNTASMAGLIAQPNASAYVATKHGIVGLTKTAALENARRNIRVNALCPGLTDTPMMFGFFEGMDPEDPQRFADNFAREVTPMGRLARPEEMADAALWLSSDKASFVTGIALPVDGGQLAI